MEEEQSEEVAAMWPVELEVEVWPAQAAPAEQGGSRAQCRP